MVTILWIIGSIYKLGDSTTDEKYKKILKRYHQLSDRHSLDAKPALPYADALHTLALFNKIHKACNKLGCLMLRHYA